MIEAEVSLYLVSRERIICLEKVVGFEVFPRVHEFVKIRNTKEGDYFAYEIVQITHREGEKPELWAFVTAFTEGRSIVSFFGDDELDAFVDGYVDEGWKRCSAVANRIVRADGTSIWSEIAASKGTR